LGQKVQRDVFELHISDLGGVDNVSEAEQSICRRIATLTVELERLECRLVKQEAPDDRLLDLYQRVTNTHRRQLESVGLARRQRDITPDLERYIAAQNAKGAAE
jgi:DNA polymerase/3'-5' exonuclease PolX